MLPHRFPLRFLKKLQPFLGSIKTKPFSSQNINKQIKPTKIIPRKIKNSSGSTVKKQNPEPKVYKSDIITKIYNILKYSTWDSAQEQLENLSIKWDSYTVTRVLKAHPPMEKAWLFFNWASRIKNFKHDQYTYNTMLDIFGEAGRISSMKFVYEQMKEKGIKIDSVTYTCLLHWMAKDGDIDGAIKCWEEMMSRRCRPNVVSYTAYMNILFCHNRVNEASAVYKEMIKSGISPNCHTYTVLMKYLACSGKVNGALDIFQKMQEAGVQPDKAACNILIETFCRTWERWAIMKILQYMKENFLVLYYPVYQKALEAFKIAGESDAFLKQVNPHLSAENPNDDTDPYDTVCLNNDLIVDNFLVMCLLSKKNLVAIDSLLNDMMEKDVSLESYVISQIIEVNSTQGRQDVALLAYRYGVKLGINIDRTAYLAMIGLFIRKNSFPKVVDIVEEMVKRGLSLGTQVNSLIIFRLGCNKEPEAAARIFDLLPVEEKSTAEYTALIGAYFSSGNPDKGLETFEIMKSKGIKVVLGTYTILINGLEKCGRVRPMEYYRKEKKKFQSESCAQDTSMGETICNLLFAGDPIVRHSR